MKTWITDTIKTGIDKYDNEMDRKNRQIKTLMEDNTRLANDLDSLDTAAELVLDERRLLQDIIADLKDEIDALKGELEIAKWLTR